MIPGWVPRAPFVGSGVLGIPRAKSGALRSVRSVRSGGARLSVAGAPGGR